MAETVAKLVAMYKQPADAAAFEKQYFGEHMALVEQIPGLRAVEVFRFKKCLTGGEPPYYMMATLTFESMDALKAALGSPEGQAAGANVMGFAKDILTMVTAEVEITDGVPVA